MIPLNDLSRVAPPLADETGAALRRVVERGRYLNGPEREGFEAEFSAYVGTAHCVGVANGTDALELALVAVGCRPGDQVVTAANAGMYSTTAALRAGLTPRYADVDGDTLGLSAETVADSLTDRVAAVVVTHLYGQMADVERIAEVCGERSVAVIEDCAQATGARRNGRAAGSIGDAAAFSFYPTKNLGAMGDAGAVVTSDREIERRVRALAEYGWDEKYRVTLAGGRNSRVDEIQAAVLRCRLPHVDDWNHRRRGIANRYAGELGGEAGRFLGNEGDDYVAHLAVMLTDRRDEVRARLTEAGVATEVHYPIPDHRQPVWNGEFGNLTLPVTERAAAQILTLPCFPEMTSDEIDRVCEALDEL
jgi:dTDP-3-amino-2,3,6-trideoxy-4-keto-D-glucose/dTDP-3-amino-3,4,6-trideoxy-alpha-D-glucose/dTDP-2,6-dideoxy-D-kanosamine transaminase